VLCLGACAPVAYGPGPQPVATANYSVEIGDRPYYTRGPYYIQRGQRYVWVRGHWARRHGRRVWIHGHYILRG
ncbi:MAG TPA: hypothetical protein VGF73_07845, partial [Chthoniobacterales bacterium]